MNIQRFAAFSDGDVGGNPAGVALADALPSPVAMQALARDVGYSETVFAAPAGDGWRVRYFAPEIEVPFCGHATIALGAALALRLGDGVFPLQLNDSVITVEGRSQGILVEAAFQSPPTDSAPASPKVVAEALDLFGLLASELNMAIPPAIIRAGADHLVLALDTRERLAAMRYDFSAGQKLMNRCGWATINLIFSETFCSFHARNPFASGGVYEDPATGAAAAALGGYLRDLGWPHGGVIDILQGEDMGQPSRLRAEIGPQRGASIRVSGTARPL